MVLLLELAIRNSRTSSDPAANDTLPFRFPLGRSLHKAFLIYDEPIVTSHHPILFYFVRFVSLYLARPAPSLNLRVVQIVWVASGMGNTVLYLAGFRYYGTRRSVSFSPCRGFDLKLTGLPSQWPFPLFFMRGSRIALDSLLEPLKFEVDAHLADKASSPPPNPRASR